MESLERAVKATRLLLEEHPAGDGNEAPMNPSESNKTRRALHFVLNILKANFRPELFIADLKDATYEIFVCRQNNERAFKLVWNLYVVAQQPTNRCSSVDNIGDIQDSVRQALDFVLHAFRDHPFTISPEGDSRVNLPPLTILNSNHENAARHERLARRIGKAWVDARIRRDSAQVQDLGTLQTSFFGLLWSGTIEQLNRASAISSDDPKRPEFERAVEELETVLREAIIRSKEQRLRLVFCGTRRAGMPQFLNVLMGQAFLPSDSESDGSRTPKLY